MLLRELPSFKSLLTSLLGVFLPCGVSLDFWGSTEPTGWKFENGQELDKKAFKDLYGILGVAHGEGAAVVFAADTATDEIIATAHGLSNGQIVTFTTTGTLPGGLALLTDHFIVNATTNRYQVALVENGTPIDITTLGTGTHSYHSGFLLPDARGRTKAGKDDMGGAAAGRITDPSGIVLGGSLGSETHTMTESQMSPHTHDIGKALLGFIGSSIFIIDNPPGPGGDVTSTSKGGGLPHNIVQPTLICNSIVKT